VLSQRLERIDADNAAYYESRSKDFQGRWAQAISRWEKDAAPLKGMRIVPYHKNTVYLSHWLGDDEVMYMERNRASPQCWSSFRPGGAFTGRARRRGDPHGLPGSKAAGWLSEKPDPVVELPYTVGGTAAAKDLFRPVRRFDRKTKAVKKINMPTSSSASCSPH